MDNNSFLKFDTSPDSCSTQGDKMSLDRQGPAVMDRFILMEILTPLIQYPGLISYLEQDISDELCERGFFNLEEGSVTAMGRDFLASIA